MLDKLTNCPNCGGTLNEAGRCSFCGSKVYDFLSFNFTGPYHKYASAKTYIRIKLNDRIVLAPVRANSLTVELEPEAFPLIKLELMGAGDMIEVESKEGKDNGTQ